MEFKVRSRDRYTGTHSDTKSEFLRKEHGDRYTGTHSDKQHRPHLERGGGPHYNNFWTGERSFRDVVSGSTRGNVHDKGIVVHLGNGNVTGLGSLAGRALVGGAKNLELLDTLPTALQNLDIADCVLRYMGGVKVLISFSSKEGAMATIKKLVQRSENPFTSLELWDGNGVKHERVVKLILSGIPIQAWSSKTTEQIGAKFGKLLTESKADTQDGDLSEDTVTVLANIAEKINEKIKLIHKGREYTMFVSEEEKGWKPKFLGLCDPLPRSGSGENHRVADERKDENSSSSSSENFAGNRPSTTTGKKNSQNPSGTGKVEAGELHGDYEETLGNQINPNGLGGPTSMHAPQSFQTPNDGLGLNPDSAYPKPFISSPKTIDPFIPGGPQTGHKAAGPLPSGPSSPKQKQNQKPTNKKKNCESPATAQQSKGVSKRKRGEKSPSASPPSKSGDSPHEDSSSHRYRNKRRAKVRVGLSKLHKKKGKKKLNIEEIEEEISNWANENPSRDMEVNEWDRQAEDGDTTEDIFNTTQTHLTEEEIVKETLDIMGMGAELGIDLQNYKNKVDEVAREQAQTKVNQ